MNNLPGIILNNDKYKDENATYIIFGNPRGGTTMIANLLIKFKVNLGENLPKNLEDHGFNLDYLKKNNDLSETELIKKIQENLNYKNKKYKIWGWKYPRVINYLEKIYEDLINPKFICVLRDPFAISKRNIFRRSKDPYQSLKESANFTLRNIKYMQQKENPTIICSYENVIKSPFAFTKMINDFLGNPIKKEDELREISKAINPKKGYNTKI